MATVALLTEVGQLTKEIDNLNILHQQNEAIDTLCEKLEDLIHHNHQLLLPECPVCDKKTTPDKIFCSDACARAALPKFGRMVMNDGRMLFK